MTLDEVNLVNELIKRNEAMPMKVKTYDDGKTHYYCPVCDHFVGTKEYVLNFCDECGQRIDKENSVL